MGEYADGHYIGIILTPVIIVFILVFVYACIWRAKRPFTHPYWSFAQWPTEKQIAKDTQGITGSLKEPGSSGLLTPDAAHVRRDKK